MAETDILDRNLIHVLPEYDTWRVDGQGGGVFDNKGKAIRQAKELAKDNAPCRVVVYAEDGTVAEQFDFD